MFLPLDREVGSYHTVREDMMDESDHAPLFATVKVTETNVTNTKLTMPKDSIEEDMFIEELAGYMSNMDVTNLNTPDAIEQVVKDLGNNVVRLWDSNAKTSKICSKSKSWWNKECTEKIQTYRTDRSPENYRAFKRVVKDSKRKFFDNTSVKLGSTMGHYGPL